LFCNNRAPKQQQNYHHQCKVTLCNCYNWLLLLPIFSNSLTIPKLELWKNLNYCWCQFVSKKESMNNYRCTIDSCSNDVRKRKIKNVESFEINGNECKCEIDLICNEEHDDIVLVFCCCIIYVGQCVGGTSSWRRLE